MASCVYYTIVIVQLLTCVLHTAALLVVLVGAANGHHSATKCGTVCSSTLYIGNVRLHGCLKLSAALAYKQLLQGASQNRDTFDPASRLLSGSYCQAGFGRP
jgi:hypothetical protein